MKKKIRNFFTLTRKANGGFTLVELIVVIAILAILGGVAVPAYSGYVKKANKQADISLVSDIEHALTLAYYNQDLTDGTAGFIMLSPNEDESMADEAGYTALAMEKTFGSSWEDAMQLKYDNWGVSWNTISYEDATAVVNSNFVQKYSSDELMAQVQAMTEAANGLSFEIGETKVGLYDLFAYSKEDGTAGDAIVDVMSKYGIGESTEDWNKLSAVEKSNVLVLATADSVANGTNADAVSALTTYSLLTAYAAENAEFNKEYKIFQDKISNVTPDNADAQYEEIKTAYNELKAAGGTDYETWKAANKTQTEKAFEAIMKGVGNAMKDNGDSILADLDNPNMFTSGIGNELYNDYLNSAYAASGYVDGDDPYGIGEMIANTPNGYVSIYYTVTNGTLYVGDTLPMN